MDRKFKIITSAAAVASVLVFSATAQDTNTQKKSDHAREHTRHVRKADWLNGACKTSEVIGMTVNNFQGEKLGTVEDLALDVESGRIVQVILSTGGFIGIGDTLSAVPPGALCPDEIHKDIHLDADKEKLKAAPKFEMSKWAECCDANYLTEVYRHYGEEPAFRFVQRGDVVLTAYSNGDGAPKAVVRDASSSKDDNRYLVPEARLTKLKKASKVMGTTVKNLQDEKVGKVENILLDVPSGRVVAIVVSTGEYLGMENELSAVPPSALRCTPDHEALQLDITKDSLSKAPHFKSDQWPNFHDTGYVGGIYRTYKVEPYFVIDSTAVVDNTARNVRDRDGKNLTPFDQGTSKADMDITAQIRKEIIAAKDMSMNARNVKIITNRGQVTLRGPVNTVEEKRLISEIAARIARAENVDNQIEVK